MAPVQVHAMTLACATAAEWHLEMPSVAGSLRLSKLCHL